MLGVEVGHLIFVPRSWGGMLGFARRSLMMQLRLRKAFLAVFRILGREERPLWKGVQRRSCCWRLRWSLSGWSWGKRESAMRRCRSMRGCHQDGIQTQMLSCWLQYPQAHNGISLNVYRIMNRLSVSGETKESKGPQHLKSSPKN